MSLPAFQHSPPLDAPVARAERLGLVIAKSLAQHVGRT